MKDLEKRLGEKNIRLVLTEAAKHHIAEESYSNIYGARPVKRYLQKHLETPMAAKLIKGEIMEGDFVTVDFADGQLVFRTEHEEQ